MTDEVKPIQQADIDAIAFVNRALYPDPTNYGTNLDRIVFDKTSKKLIVFEFKCPKKDPHKIDPNKFAFDENGKWKLYPLQVILLLVQALNAGLPEVTKKYNPITKKDQISEVVLLLVNFNKQGAEFDKHVQILKVIDINYYDPNNEYIKTEPVESIQGPNKDGYVSFEEFREWFRALNQRAIRGGKPTEYWEKIEGRHEAPGGLSDEEFAELSRAATFNDLMDWLTYGDEQG